VQYSDKNRSLRSRDRKGAILKVEEAPTALG
jgi:hypothetical protein